MVNYGKYIKINRYLQKKSISELCDGICTPSTLSKIENNKSEQQFEEQQFEQK